MNNKSPNRDGIIIACGDGLNSHVYLYTDHNHILWHNLRKEHIPFDVGHVIRMRWIRMYAHLNLFSLGRSQCEPRFEADLAKFAAASSRWRCDTIQAQKHKVLVVLACISCIQL